MSNGNKAKPVGPEPSPEIDFTDQDNWSMTDERWGRCTECNLLLNRKISIYIMTNIKTREEKAVCQWCGDDEWSEGWLNDIELDELEFPE